MYNLNHHDTVSKCAMFTLNFLQKFTLAYRPDNCPTFYKRTQWHMRRICSFLLYILHANHVTRKLGPGAKPPSRGSGGRIHQDEAF